MERINNAVDYVKGRIGSAEPAVGIVLGSGLGKLADKIASPTVIPYRDIPGFPVSTAIGHKGNFIVGTLGGKTVMAMQGRFHFYEGYPMELVVLPIRVMIRLGIKCLFVSNAAGGVNFGFKVGDLMIIRDHINLLPNPLVGQNLEEFGPRFPDMTIGSAMMQSTLSGTPDHLLEAQGVYLPAMPFRPEYGWTIRDFGPLYVPREGGRVAIDTSSVALYSKIIEFETGRLPETRDGKVYIGGAEVSEYEFRKDYCFFGGDNVLNSRDSRYFGFVPEEYITGIATRILFSRDPYSGRIDWSRTLRRIGQSDLPL